MKLYNMRTGAEVAEISDEYNSVMEYLNTMDDESLDRFIEETGGKVESDYAFMCRVKYAFAKNWGFRVVLGIANGTYDESDKTVCVYYNSKIRMEETQHDYSTITRKEPV